MEGHKRPLLFIRAVCFVLLGVLLLAAVQHVMTLKWEYSVRTPFRTLEGSGPAQVLFMGASPIYTSVSPVNIYEQYGITSLDLASPDQHMALSYDLLREALRSWTPDVVVLEAARLLDFFGSNMNLWMQVLADAPMSRLKLRDAMSYAEVAEMEGAETYEKALFGALFPLYQFHSRWTELGKNDFVRQEQFLGLTASVAKGSQIISGVSPAVTSVELMNSIAAVMESNASIETVSIADGQVSDSIQETAPLYSPQLSEPNVQYFEKIKELCQDNGIELLLVKIPDTYNPVTYGTAWTVQRHEKVAAFAAEHGVPFLDLLYDVDTGIDWGNDSYDGGIHANIRGAQKVSAYLGAYLQETYQLPSLSEPSYDAALPLYQQAETVAVLQTELDLGNWIRWVKESDRDLTVAMAVYEDMSLGLTEDNIRILQSIGLQTDFGAMSFADTFLAVWEHSADGTDTIPYEAMSNRELTYAYNAPDGGTLIYLLSRGGYQYANVSISVDGAEQTLPTRGLHLIAYDQASGLVLDDIWVDFSTGGTVSRIYAYENQCAFQNYLNQTARAES